MAKTAFCAFLPAVPILLQNQVSKTSIAKIIGITPRTIYRLIKTSGYARRLDSRKDRHVDGDRPIVHDFIE